jgi:hypothetical protein
MKFVSIFSVSLRHRAWPQESNAKVETVGPSWSSVLEQSIFLEYHSISDTISSIL